MDKKPSAETLRTDPANWILGVVYRCPADPRVVVRQRLPVGWTWNFGHRLVLPALATALALFPGMPLLAWWAGLRSAPALALIAAGTLGLLVRAASRLARDPDTR